MLFPSSIIICNNQRKISAACRNCSIFGADYDDWKNWNGTSCEDGDPNAGKLSDPEIYYYTNDRNYYALIR